MSESNVTGPGAEVVGLPQVLVVDDDSAARALAKEMLGNQGFSVALAKNGLEMLHRVKETQPDLILLDIKMPELGGFEACERLRVLPGGRNLPVIMLTGNDDADAVERAFAAQATDFVSKPVRWTVLVPRIRHLIRAANAIKELERNQQRLAGAQKMAKLGWWDWEVASDKLVVSEYASEIIGHPPEAIPSFAEFSAIVFDDDRESVWERINSGVLKGSAYVVEYRVLTAQGELRYLRSQGEPFGEDEEKRPLGYAGMILDITEQRKNEEMIRRMAFYDEVTGLHNRVAFMEELELVLSVHKRLDTVLAVIYLDIDDFKRVNDSMGHAVGDSLLKQFADRLVGVLRASDLAASGDKSSVLARLGGDEFTLLLTGLKDKAGAETVAIRIQAALAQPFVLEANSATDKTDSHELYVGASVGIAVYPEGGTSADELLQNADTAMYEAKHAGKNTYRFYSDIMNGRALERLDMETSLRGALDNNEFFLEYQPQIDLNTGEMVAVEALLRWRHPDLGLVPLEEFLPLAEDTGQIIPIGAWVLEAACRQLKQWQDAGLPEFKVAVNLSGFQFRHGKLEGLVSRVLEAVGIDAKFLELELTERSMMGDVEKSIATLQALKTMGVMIAIDDFGVGSTSLSHLQRFPIDTLKIDHSFIQGLGHDTTNEAITNTIIALAKSLDFTIVAGGLENKSQLLFLQQKHCDIAQGFLFAKAMVGDQIPAYLQQSKLDTARVIGARS